MCAAAVVFDCINQRANTFGPRPSEFSVVQRWSTAMTSALLLQTLRWCDRGRRLGCGTAHPAVATESYPRYYGLVGSFSCATAPKRGTRGAVLLSSRVWKKDVIDLGTRDWYLMCYSNTFLTGGQKHTHTHTHTHNTFKEPAGGMWGILNETCTRFGL